MKRLLEAQELRERARELGVSLEGLPAQLTEDPYGRSANIDQLNDPEIQRRVMEAERRIREGRLWLLAVISALASVVSAAAAWYAVVHK